MSIFQMLCVAFAGVVAFGSGALAQTINISGSVVDSATSQAIAGASVKLAEYPSVTTTTATNGSFTLSGSTTAAHRAAFRACSGGEIVLDRSSLAVSGLSGAKTLSVEVFSSNGARLFHAIRTIDANTARIGKLWQVPGLYCVKISIDGIQHTAVSNGTNRLSIPVMPATVGSFDKSSATYTLLVTASGYSPKNVVMSSTQGDAGTIRLSSSATPIGVWTNVTPSGMTMDSNFPYSSANFGAQDMLVDPARPQDVYAFACYQGCWRSQDYGKTFVKVSNGSPSDINTIEQGRPWTAAIDPNPNRDPNTAPTMFTTQGYGNYNGIWKSTDRGATWARLSGPGSGDEDVYSIDIERNGANPSQLHLIASNHDNGNVYESLDGGATWSTKTTPAGASCYVFFLNNGATWLAIGARGTVNYAYRTTNSGASWAQVAAIAHEHGSTNIANAGNGIWYAASQGDAGPIGVFKSTNDGASWTSVWGGAANGVTCTSKHLYAQYAMAWTGGGAYQFPPTGANPYVANLDGTGWTAQTQPAGFGNGAKRFAVTNDGVHNIVLSGAWTAGIWRYVEP